MHALHIHTLAWFLTALRPSCPPAFHATATQDASRPIKGKPTGTSLKDLGFGEVGMDEGWAACPTKGWPFPHGRDPRVDPRALTPRENITAPFSIGGGKTALYHRANADGSVSPVVDSLRFPNMSGMVAQIHRMGLRAGWYLNDCLSYCSSLGDHCPAAVCIPGDVKAFVEYQPVMAHSSWCRDSDGWFDWKWPYDCDKY